MTTNDVLKCPPEQPFAVWEENTCIACSEPNPIFDLSQSKCIQCPSLFAFDPSTHACIPTECAPGQIYNAEDGGCSCPPESPYFDGEACITCYLPKFWNTEKMACDVCESGSIYNLDTQSCEQCPLDAPLVVGLKCEKCEEGKHYNERLKICITCPGGTVYDPVLEFCHCPEEAPIEDPETSECIPCPEGSKYNPQTRVC